MMMPVGGGPVKKYYYHANNLYNVSAITDKNGVVVEHYNYSPYGEATILDAAGTTVLGASTIANPWTFTGRRLDAETGLMYYRARYYDVDLGRFVGRDSLNYPENYKKSKRGEVTAKIATSLYKYADCSPLTMVDPFGFHHIKPIEGFQAKYDLSREKYPTAWHKEGDECCLISQKYWEYAGYNTELACIKGFMDDYGSGLIGTVTSGVSAGGSASAAWLGSATWSGILAIPGVAMGTYDLGVLIQAINECPKLLCVETGMLQRPHDYPYGCLMCYPKQMNGPF
jgi:RHS repeat-associated protein